MGVRAGATLALAMLLASCGTQPQKPVEHPPAPPAQPVPPTSTAPNGITIAAVGDIMMGTDYPQNVLPDDDGVSFLSGLTATLSAADIAFGNVEGVLMDGGEAVKRCRPAVTKNNKTNPTAAPTALAVAPAAVTRPPSSPDTSAAARADGPTPAPEEAGANPPPAPTAVTQPAETAPTTFQVERETPTESATTPGDASPPTGAPDAAEQALSAEALLALEPVTASVTRLPEAAPPPAPAGSCFVFRSPTRYATYLRDAGIDVVSLANNHAQDFGDPGRDSTMRTLDAVGIRHSGREGDIAEWTTHGRRFALVAFAPNVGSHQLNDLARAKDIVTQLAAHHDIVIVSFHGGGEGEGASKLPFAHEIYAGEDRGDVVEFAHAVIDAGADLVLGHGPHVLRPLELYRDRLVAYSLGNFATYYGISVNGIRGIAAVLVTRIADDGRFLDGRIESTNQLRPAGPTPDPARRAITQLRDLTNEAFPAGRLAIHDDGRLEAGRGN
jgi:hypothetical protein